jgi:hypothetical protein
MQYAKGKRASLQRKFSETDYGRAETAHGRSFSQFLTMGSDPGDHSPIQIKPSDLLEGEAIDVYWENKTRMAMP